MDDDDDGGGSPRSTSDSVGHHKRACATDASSNHRTSWTGADTVKVSSPSARYGLQGVEVQTGATRLIRSLTIRPDTESVRHGPDFHTICTNVERSIGASAPIGNRESRTRRLTLRSWSQVVRDSQVVLPDSHDQCLEPPQDSFGPTGKTGSIGLTCRTSGNIPRVIRRQQWSIFNVIDVVRS